MNWETLYLLCFWFGFLLSAFSLLAGMLNLHVPVKHLHLSTHHAGKDAGLSPLNFPTLAAFLAWFGGAGYLLLRYVRAWVYLGLLFAAMSGLLGAAAVFLFLTRVLLRHEQAMDPADYEMIGVFGRVTSPVLAGGTGEMHYTRDGARRAIPVRSENGGVLARGAEVVVTRFEKGIAYVRLWEELERGP